MLEAQIEALKEELNRMIEKNMDGPGIYDLSTRLDALIVQYYKQKPPKPLICD